MEQSNMPHEFITDEEKLEILNFGPSYWYEIGSPKILFEKVDSEELY